MRHTTEWKDPDVARYLLASSGYDGWRLDDGGIVLWITPDGREVINADDIGDRRAAVEKFVSSRGSVSRSNLEQEFKDDCNRVYEFEISSVLFAPFSLPSVKQVLEEEFPAANVSIYTSGYNGAKTIHVRADDVDFEGYPDCTDGDGADSDYLFSGAIESTADASVSKVKQLFARLTEAGIEVQFEVYDPMGTTLFEQRPTRENKALDAKT